MAEENSEKVPLHTSTNANGETVDYGAYFKREGDTPEHTEKFAKTTPIGECRNPRRFHWFEWVFLVVATFSMLGVVALAVYRFVYFQENFVNITVLNQSQEGVDVLAECNKWVCISDFIFAVALLVNLAFCAFYCYDGVLRERPFEVLAYVIAVIVIIIYTIGNFGYQLYRRNHNVKDEDESDFYLKIARFVLVMVFGPINILLALLSWWKMGFLVFNVVGADKTLTWAYRSRSFFLTLQWFSLQVLLNIFVLAWSRDGQMLHLAEKVVLGVLVGVVFLTIIMGNVAVLWEYHVVSIIWYILMIPNFVYSGYKLIEVSVHWSHYSSPYTVYNSNGPEVRSTLAFVGAALLVACIVGLIVSVLLAIFMAISQKYFGKGLKGKVPPPFSKK